MSNDALRVLAILNCESGTLLSSDLDVLSERITARFKAAGHAIDVKTVKGDELVDTIQAAAERTDVDVLLVGGGDGSISTAAGIAWKAGKTLAVLPGGTMNLFARTLQLPLDPMQAIDRLAEGHVRSVDIATCNGVPFVHQYSLGLHPQTVKARQSYTYQSRWGKMMASVRAFFTSLETIPLCQVRLRINGEVFEKKISALSITNNLFGSVAPPYALRPDGGELGVYFAGRLTRQDALSLAAEAFLGQMEENPRVTIKTATDVDLTILKAGKMSHIVLDGELHDLDETVTFTMYPGALTVLA